jgi:epimerase transport system membrane fusion protein
MNELERDALTASHWMNADRADRRLGYLLIVVFVGIGGLWSSCAPLESAALAPGIVQVEGKRKAIQHLEGGIVADILVSNGDRVTEGEILLQLDSAKDRAELKIVSGRLTNARAEVDRLRSERDERTSVEFSAELVATAASDQTVRNAMASEAALFEARRADRLGEANVLTERIKGLEALATSTQSVLASLEQEILDLSALLEEGYVDKQRLRELERSRSQVTGELADVRLQTVETELQILQLSKRFKSEVVDQLTQAQEQLYDLEQQFTAIADRVHRATVRAPVEGTVLNLRPNTIGGVVRQGDTLVELVPDASKLVVEARITPMDIDRVRLGQAAEIRFSVFKDAYLVSGVLTKVSADRLVDPATDIPYYAAEIQLLRIYTC